VSEIRDIGAVIESMSEIAAGIAAAVEQQGAATAEIAQNVAQASAGSQEVSTNIAGVGSAAGEAKETSRRILEAATKLSDEADSMQRQVAGFLARVRLG
jgi:methyl-accepting chemotaxis protein